MLKALGRYIKDKTSTPGSAALWNSDNSQGTAFLLTVSKGHKNWQWGTFRCTGKTLPVCDQFWDNGSEGTSVALSYEKYMNPNVMGSFEPRQAVVLRSQQMA